MSSLKLFLLGPPRIELAEQPIEIRPRKALGLLIYLAGTGESHLRDSLATLFWPEADQRRARAALRRRLSELNQTLGREWLQVTRERLGLEPDVPLWLDVDQFQQCLARCQTHGHPADEPCDDCLAPLTEAVALYRNDFLTGFTLPDCPDFDDWQYFQAEGLRQTQGTVLERLVRLYNEQGNPSAAIPYARRWLALDPLHEPAHRQLMRLYTQAGQQAAALRQYQLCVDILAAELGLSPAEETTDLYQRIHAGDLSGRVAAPARLEVLPSPPPSPVPRGPAVVEQSKITHNLPAQTTPFVGREGELAELARLFDDPAVRHITILGPGGMGKTRLALEAAAALVDRYQHGVYFVSLAPLSDPETIVPTIAEAVRYPFQADQRFPKQQLLDYFQQKSMLLVLDNFEHLLGQARLLDGAGLVNEILQAAPQVKILTTSRTRLMLSGETVFILQGMDVPAREMTEDTIASAKVTDYGAIRLFMLSARRAQPSFELTEENREAITHICQLVEGNPLGIILAATWLELLTPAEIAAEISQGIDLLEAALHDLPDRQRSMRAVFDHSWQLLAGPERAVFRQLSVFRGGFTREAAEGVTGASLQTLMALVNKSLLQRSAAARYSVHELLRQYAAEKLDQDPIENGAAHSRHCRFYTAFVRRREAEWYSPRQQAVLAEAEADIENVRAAWAWAADHGQVEHLARAVEGLGRLYKWLGRYQEGEAVFQRAAQRLATVESVEGWVALAKVLIWQATFSRILGHHRQAGQLLRKSKALLARPELMTADLRSEKAAILLEMGELARFVDFKEASPFYEQSLALYQALDDRVGTARTLFALGMGAFDAGDFGLAEQLLARSLTIRRTLGGQKGIADSLSSLGFTVMNQGRFEEAEGLVRESFTIHQAIGDRASLGRSLRDLAGVCGWRGKWAECEVLYQESLLVYDDLGDQRNVAEVAVHKLHAKMESGKYEEVRGQAQIALIQARETDFQWAIGRYLGHLGEVVLAEERYAEAQQWLQESATVFRRAEHRIDLGAILADSGLAARGLGHIAQARQYLLEALTIGAQFQAVIPIIKVLPVMALLKADQGQLEQAVELHALATRYPIIAESRWSEDVAGRHITAVAATLRSEVVRLAREKGQTRDLWATARELMAELEGALDLPAEGVPRPLTILPSAADEIRLVTVLFADMSRSVELTWDLQPEETADLVNRLLKAMMEIVARYEGRIDRLLGDGLLAIFGAPQAHEDDPERALQAALDIQTAAQAMGLGVTVGLNTGAVYFGQMGSELHRETTVMGPVVNLASRLQSQAAAGQILVGEATYRQTRRAFRFSSLSLNIKGISEPVSAYRLVRPRRQADKSRGIEGLRAELIGRDEELSKLKMILGTVCQGQGQMVSLIGEAGVGKSRLVAESKQLALTAAGGTPPPLWLQGRCLEMSQSASYWPFIDLLRAYFAWGPDDDEPTRAGRVIAALQGLVDRGDLPADQFDELGPLLGNLLSLRFGSDWDERLKNAGPQEIRHRTFQALDDFFLALARQGPLVLVVEDLHWADSLSVDLISHLMEALPSAPLLLLCVYRPEREHKCWRLATIASRKCPAYFAEIRLRELTPQQSRQLIESLLVIEDLPVSVKEMILSKAQGNPFFVEEVVSSLIDAELVYRDADIWRARAAIEAVAVPESVQSVIQSRVDRLEPMSKQVLQQAAVMGRLFRPRVLAQVIPSEIDLEETLWTLEDQALIYPEETVPELVYSFKHVLTQETIYQTILRRPRTAFHRGVAAAMEQLYHDNLEVYYEQLAYHYDRSDVAEKAVVYLLKAGEKARRAYLNEEAIGYFRRALARLNELPPGESRQGWQFEALKGLGQIYTVTSNFSEAETHLREAIALGREMGLPPRQLVRLYCWLGDLLLNYQQRHEESLRLAEEGLALLADDTESAEAAMMNAILAHGFDKLGNVAKYREYGLRNAQFAEHLPYSEELRLAFGVVSGAYFLNRDMAEAARWRQVSKERATENYNLLSLAEHNWSEGETLAWVEGKLHAGLERSQQASRLFQKIGDAKRKNWSQMLMGWIYLALGDLQIAEQTVADALEATKTFNEEFLPNTYHCLGIIYLAQGELQKAEAILQKALGLAKGLPNLAPTDLLVSLGHICLAQGKRREAAEHFQAAVVTSADPELVFRIFTDIWVKQPHLVNALSGLEAACEDPATFRAFCHNFRHAHPGITESFPRQWYL